MDRRKIVSTGGSSFVVTLPIKWIKEHHLKRGQELIFLTLEDGSLLLTHKLDKKEYTKTLEIDEMTRINHLKRAFYSAYLGGYTNIQITSEQEIPSKIRAEIDIMSSNLVGVESGGEKRNSITLRNVVYSEGVKFQNFVSTLMDLTLTMYENTFEALQSRSETIAKLVPEQDKKINPKNYAITRMMNTYLQDLTLTGSLEISLIEAQSYFAVSLFLEAIADNAVLISHNIVDAIKLADRENMINEVAGIVSKFTDVMGEIFRNWKNENENGIKEPISEKNVEVANEYLDALVLLNEQCKIIMKKYHEESLYSVFYGILEKIRRSIKILSNIALVTIDLVEGILQD